MIRYMNDETKKKPGRPAGYRAKNPASERLPSIRVTPEQLDSYKAKADTEEKSLSGWIKTTLDKAAK